MRIGLAVVVCGVGLLSGCSGGFTVGNGTGAAGGGVKLAGRVVGGQQPIAGAQVYLFAAGASGYGGAGIAASASNASVSLLTNVPGSTTLDTSGGATNGDYFVTTDAGGSFTITGDYSCTSGQQVYLYALGGNPGLGTGVNSAAGLMAALGTCPAAGNFLSATPYIVMNEVSTVAAAYAFAGFATDAVHVGSSGTALAQTGIANAFANAANLETLSTGVALAEVPARDGWVPQQEINTLANVLAACVNSNGAVTGPTNATACYTLFTNALAGGATGAQPTDTATAAINIAHNPGVNVAALYGLVGGTATPFAPGLSAAPNDWTVALSFFGGGMSASAGGLAIDGAGNVWVYTTESEPNLAEFASSGAAISPSTGYPLEYTSVTTYGETLVIDPSGNSWLVGSPGVFEFSNSGTLLSPVRGYSGSGPSDPGASSIAIDGSGDAWVANTYGLPIAEYSNSGTPVTVGGYSAFGGTPYGIAIDGSGNAWISNSSRESLVKLSNVGAALSPGVGYTGGGLNSPRCVAADGRGNIWVVNQYPASLSEFSNAGAALSPPTGFTGGGLSHPVCLAIDGAGNVWVATDSSVAEFSSSGSPISPSNGLSGAQPSAIAVDGSGNLWMSPLGGDTLEEIVGVAAPVITPIAAGLPATPTADGSSNLGTRP